MSRGSAIVTFTIAAMLSSLLTFHGAVSNRAHAGGMPLPSHSAARSAAPSSSGSAAPTLPTVTARPAHDGRLASTSAPQEVEAAYRAMAEALRRLDWKGYVAYLSDDFQEVGQDGKRLDRVGYALGLRNWLSSAQTSRYSYEVREYVVGAREITARRDESFATDLLIKGEKHRVEQTSAFRDRWAKSPAGWRLAEQRTLSTTMKIDGKITEQK